MLKKSHCYPMIRTTTRRKKKRKEKDEKRSDSYHDIGAVVEDIRLSKLCYQLY
jgi:hypothetical protein